MKKVLENEKVYGLKQKSNSHLNEWICVFCLNFVKLILKLCESLSHRKFSHSLFIEILWYVFQFMKSPKLLAIIRSGPTTNLILYLVCYFPQYLVIFYKLKEHFAFTLISSTWLLLIRKIEEVFKGQQLWSSAVIKSVVIYHCVGLSVSLYILGWFPIHT